jgi:hypothetical protein
MQYMPVEVALMGEAGRELTHKQKAFAREIALGTKGAEAYRKVYNTTSSKQRTAEQASRLRKQPKIAASVEREKLMIEARKQRTPAELREWVISQLRLEAEDPTNPPSVRVNALQLLGKVTEVAAFTERKERVVLHSSLDLRAKIEQSIKELTLDAVDVEVDSLEQELRLNVAQRLNDTERLNDTFDADDQAETEEERLNTAERLNTTPCLNAADADPTHPGGPQMAEAPGGPLLHNIPHQQSPTNSEPTPHTNWVPSTGRG